MSPRPDPRFAHAADRNPASSKPPSNPTARSPQQDLAPVNGHALPEPAPRVVPLTPAQARMWAVQQRHPETTVFHLPFALRLRGKLHPGALTRALTTIGQRHESLRTVFVPDGDGVTALVQPTFNLTIPIVRSELNVRSPSAASPLFAYHRLEETRRPFDLARGPLLRARLFNFEHDDRVLVFTLHRLAGDEASVAILEQELAQMFAAAVGEVQVDLPPLPYQAGDLAANQQRLIASDEGASQLAYWTQHLAGPTPLTAPSDRPRTARRSTHVDRAQRLVPVALTSRLTRLARAESVAPETTLLAAVILLLAGEMGREDVAIATRVDGRSRPGTERVVGSLASTIVIRTNLSGGPSFRQVLRRVHLARAAAQQHQDVPFEHVAAALCRDQPSDLADPWPVSFAWEAASAPLAAVPGDPESGSGTRLERMPLAVDESLSELAITVCEQTDGWLVTFTYATDLFTTGRVAELLDRLTALLNQVVGDPDQRMSPATAGVAQPTVAATAAKARSTPGGSLPTTMIMLPARSSLVPLCTGDEQRLPVFLSPGGAGTASMLAAHQAHFERLALGRPVYAFLATKDAGETDGHAWTEATAAANLREVLLRQAAGPYLLLGSCLGGILTMAMAQQMYEAGLGLPHVVLLDTRHPGFGHMGPEEVWRELTPPTINRRSLQVGTPPSPPTAVEAANLASIEAAAGPDDPQLEGPMAKGSDAGLEGEAFYKRLLYGARYLRLKQHRPRPYPGTVTVLANQDWLTRYPALGWAPPAVGELRLHELPGDHEGFLEDQLDLVGDLLRPLLDEIERAG